MTDDTPVPLAKAMELHRWADRHIGGMTTGSTTEEWLARVEFNRLLAAALNEARRA